MRALKHVTRWFAALALALAAASPALAQAPAKRPNIIMIMGDDIGWANIGAYNQGVISMRTLNLDRLAAEGSWSDLASMMRALLTRHAAPVPSGRVHGARTTLVDAGSLRNKGA